MTGHRNLWEISREIRRDWKNPHFGALPYMGAMSTLNGIDDTYIEDSARSIVLYFLSNATGWRGEVAKRVKKELRGMLK
jgi:hypothetical protein